VRSDQEAEEAGLDGSHGRHRSAEDSEKSRRHTATSVKVAAKASQGYAFDRSEDVRHRQGQARGANSVASTDVVLR